VNRDSSDLIAHLHLDDIVKQVAELKAKLMASPEEKNSPKIQSIKNQVSNGLYQAQSHHIARKIVEQELFIKTAEPA
jgi:anti-sigma28 factor (negative regulator of flagellin synthesis)